MKKLILSLLTAFLLPLCFSEQTDGYFLSLKQKGQLVGLGRIKDSIGTWYDIYICPGYVAPIQYGWKNLKQAGNNFGEYGHRDKYRKIKKQSGDAFEWGFKDCLYNFAWKGAGQKWKQNFSAAKQRTDKRVFGWWIAYPWATLRSTVDNALRIPTGLAGALLGTAWGGAVVPAAGMTDSSVKGVWNGAIEGVVLPACGLAWNTVISPPMALAGQQPSPDRADGFWVREVSEGWDAAPSDDDLSELLDWGTALHRETARYREQRVDVSNELTGKLNELNRERNKAHKRAAAQRAALRKQENARVKKLMDSSADLQRKWSSIDVKSHGKAIERFLKQQPDLSEEECQEILHLLNQYPPAFYGEVDRCSAPKTNPAKEAIGVINDLL